jgi:hypothetical protein
MNDGGCGHVQTTMAHTDKRGRRTNEVGAGASAGAGAGAVAGAGVDEENGHRQVQVWV